MVTVLSLLSLSITDEGTFPKLKSSASLSFTCLTQAGKVSMLSAPDSALGDLSTSLIVAFAGINTLLEYTPKLLPSYLPETTNTPHEPNVTVPSADIVPCMDEEVLKVRLCKSIGQIHMGP